MEEKNITASLVSEEDRMDFLPRHCGRHMLTFEDSIYAFARVLCPEYDGGYWNFWELDNGGFFMSPRGDEPLLLRCSGNYYEGRMSPQAAGIVITLFALNSICEKDELFIEAYYRLKDFACEHAEASEILAAID